MENENCKNYTYYPEIDICKAIGIILVVIGHSFPDASSKDGISFDLARIIYSVIYSFHMPFFFILSGFVSMKFNTSLNEKKERVVTRAKRLLIPYFIWGGIYFPFRLLLNQFASRDFNVYDGLNIFFGDNPYSGLWFLYAIFIIEVVQIFIVDKESKLDVMMLCSFVGLLTSKFLLISEPIYWFFSYMFFFLLGKIICLNYSRFILFFSKISIYFSGIVVFVLVNNYIIGDIIPIHKRLLMVLTSLTGSICIMIASKIIVDKFRYSKITEWFVNLGKICIQVYILSGPILVFNRIVFYRLLGMEYYNYCFFTVFVSIGLSAYVAEQLDNYSKVRKLLFGS